jgi:hypothetical protein
VRGKGSSGKSIIRNLVTYHNLCNKLKSSIIQAAQENANATWKWFNSALARPAEGRRRKEEIAMQKRLIQPKKTTLLVCTFTRCILLLTIGKLYVQQELNLDCWVVRLQNYEQ